MVHSSESHLSQLQIEGRLRNLEERLSRLESMVVSLLERLDRQQLDPTQATDGIQGMGDAVRGAAPAATRTGGLRAPCWTGGRRAVSRWHHGSLHRGGGPSSRQDPDPLRQPDGRQKARRISPPGPDQPGRYHLLRERRHLLTVQAIRRGSPKLERLGATPPRRSFPLLPLLGTGLVLPTRGAASSAPTLPNRAWFAAAQTVIATAREEAAFSALLLEIGSPQSGLLF